jgi:hypothetical protein
MMARSVKPQHINKAAWYYEERSSLLLVHEIRSDDGAYLRTDQIKIPWRKIEASMKRVKAARRRASRVQ